MQAAMSPTYARDLRIRFGLTQLQAAVALRKDPATISRYERGLSPIPWWVSRDIEVLYEQEAKRRRK